MFFSPCLGYGKVIVLKLSVNNIHYRKRQVEEMSTLPGRKSAH